MLFLKWWNAENVEMVACFAATDEDISGTALAMLS
jgi:hypothetical protein